MSRVFQAFNLQRWINENKHLLKPPVGNKCIWVDGDTSSGSGYGLKHDFIVMAVGGPNERTDFHVNSGEEFFYQVEGNMILKIINPQGQMQDIAINAGDIYLLPANTPHSPQRPANSVGLVIEKHRVEGLLDGLQWYCEKCQNKLYEEFFQLTNIETQFAAVFNRYYDSEHTLCKKCGTQNGRKWIKENPE